MLLVDETNSPLDIFFIGLHRIRTHHILSKREEHHVELIVRIEVEEQIAHQFLGNIQWKAIHGARDIDNKNVFARRDVLLGYPFGRLHHAEEKVLVLTFIKEHTRLNLIALKGVVEHHIAVASICFGGVEGDLGVGEVKVTDLHLVAGTRNILDGNGRVDGKLIAKLIGGHYRRFGVRSLDEVVVRTMTLFAGL